MDINSIIRWHTGMEVNSETIKSMYEDQNSLYLMVVSATIGDNQLGIIPRSQFNNEGTFVRNTFEMPHFRCTAMIPSGGILDVDEAVRVPIPMLYGSEYYLAVTFGKENIFFEHQGVPYERPSYVYSIKTLSELTDEMFPVIRFSAKDGILNCDVAYIPPTLQLADNPLFKDHIARYMESLDAILKHPNMEKNTGYRALLSYKFALASIRPRTRTSDFVLMLQDIVQALDHFVFSQVEQENPIETQQPSFYDIAKWLDWVWEYMKAAFVLLDKLVIEDKTIDIEALKEQIMKELYEKLYNDLYNALYAKIKEELTAELTDNLKQALTTFMNDELKPAILEELKVELSDMLYDKLYKALYDALFAALNIPRPVEEEDTFMPLI